MRREYFGRLERRRTSSYVGLQHFCNSIKVFRRNIRLQNTGGSDPLNAHQGLRQTEHNDLGHNSYAKLRYVLYPYREEELSLRVLLELYNLCSTEERVEDSVKCVADVRNGNSEIFYD